MTNFEARIKTQPIRGIIPGFLRTKITQPEEQEVALAPEDPFKDQRELGGARLELAGSLAIIFKSVENTADGRPPTKILNLASKDGTQQEVRIERRLVDNDLYRHKRLEYSFWNNDGRNQEEPLRKFECEVNHESASITSTSESVLFETGPDSGNGAASVDESFEDFRFFVDQMVIAAKPELTANS